MAVRDRVLGDVEAGGWSVARPGALPGGLLGEVAAQLLDTPGSAGTPFVPPVRQRRSARRAPPGPAGAQVRHWRRTCRRSGRFLLICVSRRQPSCHGAPWARRSLGHRCLCRRHEADALRARASTRRAARSPRAAQFRARCHVSDHATTVAARCWSRAQGAALGETFCTGQRRSTGPPGHDHREPGQPVVSRTVSACVNRPAAKSKCAGFQRCGCTSCKRGARDAGSSFSRVGTMSTSTREAGAARAPLRAQRRLGRSPLHAPTDADQTRTRRALTIRQPDTTTDPPTNTPTSTPATFTGPARTDLIFRRERRHLDLDADQHRTPLPGGDQFQPGSPPPSAFRAIQANTVAMDLSEQHHCSLDHYSITIEADSSIVMRLESLPGDRRLPPERHGGVPRPDLPEHRRYGHADRKTPAATRQDGYLGPLTFRSVTVGGGSMAASGALRRYRARFRQRRA